MAARARTATEGSPFSGRLVGVYNMACDRDGRAIQADFLFARHGLRA